MELLCLGLNHKTAPVEIRERFAVGNHKLGEAAGQLHSLAEISEAVVVSTCNRTEFYVVAPSAEEAAAALQSHLAGKTQGAHDLSAHFYRFEKHPAARHLCRVVSGLDSMMLGETEIFGQVKQSYQAALDAGSTAAVLNRLFQRSASARKCGPKPPSRKAPPQSAMWPWNSPEKSSATSASARSSSSVQGK
jgi:glutamyl-tRNA reductase